MTSLNPRTGLATAPTQLSLAHIERLTDAHGIFEHADGDQPRVEHGYCTDDVARALEFAVREARSPAFDADTPADADARQATLAGLIDGYLAFVEDAVQADGSCHNRRNAAGAWTDTPAGGDWWGRAVRALGVTAARSLDPQVSARAARAFARAAHWTTRDVRAQAYAAIGAAEVIEGTVPRLEAPARRILTRFVAMVPATSLAAGPSAGPGYWPWPEPRLTYSNASIPAALIVAGAALRDRAITLRGIDLLGWLLELQTRDGHLSPTGSGGRGPGDAGPQFDQQPIEAAELAAACALAYRVTGNDRWSDGVATAWGWFLGHNDGEELMFDPDTGAGYDGLGQHGRSLNRGAESTLAAHSALQSARLVGVAGGAQ